MIVKSLNGNQNSINTKQTKNKPGIRPHISEEILRITTTTTSLGLLIVNLGKACHQNNKNKSAKVGALRQCRRLSPRTAKTVYSAHILSDVTFCMTVYSVCRNTYKKVLIKY